MKKQEYLDRCHQRMEANNQAKLNRDKAIKRYHLRNLLIRIFLVVLLIITCALLIFDPFHNRNLVARLSGLCFIGAAFLPMSNEYPPYSPMLPLPMLPIGGFEDEE